MKEYHLVYEFFFKPHPCLVDVKVYNQHYFYDSLEGKCCHVAAEIYHSFIRDYISVDSV